MSDPSKADRGVSRRRDPQDEVGIASWMIVGVFALAVIGLAFSTINSSRTDRTAVAANRSDEAPVIVLPALLEDETTGQSVQPAR